MSKLNLPRLQGGYLDAAQLNSWATLLEAAIENTLSLDGTLPNALEADLDLNGRGLLNSGGSSTDPNAVLTRSEIVTLIQGYSSGYVIQKKQSFTTTAGQTTFNLTTMSYQPEAGNLAVYVDGIRTFDFVEVNPTTFVLPAQSAGKQVVAVTNDYLATVSLPAHTHAWTDIIGAPVYTTRWPAYSEITGVPSTFPPSAHTHSAADIVSGRLADPRRGVFVQASAPTLGPSDAGALWFW